MVSGEWVCVCATCNKPFVYRDKDGRRYTVIQAGHFMSRTLGATRYDERNVHGQCSYCNKWRSGEQYKMGMYIDTKYGPGTAAKLFKLSTQEFRFKREWLENKITYYKVAIVKYESMW
jgi:hypothetical protein